LERRTRFDAEKAALQFFMQAGATIVEMGVTVGGADTPPAPTAPPGDIRSEGWGLYIDGHPELIEQGFPIFTVVDVNCSQKKVAYVRADPSTCSDAPPPRMTAAELQAFRDYRRGRQATAKIWMDTAGADQLGVDAVVYPGLLSDISLNDGGGQPRELRAPRYAGRGKRDSNCGVPGWIQQSRTTDQHSAARTRVGRRQAGGDGVRVRVAGQRGRPWPC
jgi:hypothetical protein